MLRYLEKITSLKNLSCARPSGQIATLLMLVMVGVLVMIMVTVNLGKVSNTATSLSNAADSAALYLASQLATKSTQLYQALDYDTEKCQKGGFLSLILAIIVAIIAIVVAFFTCGAGLGFMAFLAQNMMTVMIAGAIGGAIGGAAGGAIAGTGVLSGAIQGAMIGAAIGSVASGIGSAVTAAQTSAAASQAAAHAASVAANQGASSQAIALSAQAAAQNAGASTAVAQAMGQSLAQAVSQGVVSQTALEATAQAAMSSALSGSSTGTIGSETVAVDTAMPIETVVSNEVALTTIAQEAAHAVMMKSAATAAMNTLGVGAKFYNESVDQKMTFAAISAAAKSTQNLPELDRYRENVFLQALSQTVDDPRDTKDAGVCQEPKDGDGTMKCDPYDSDGDGNKKETVPYFQYWWDRRMEAFKEILPELKETTDAFINETLAGLKDELDAYKQTYSCESGTDLTGYGGYMCTPLWTPGSLYRYGLCDWKDYSSCNGVQGCKGSANESEVCKDIATSGDPGENGIVIAVAEAMEGAGYKLDFYKRTEKDPKMREDYEGECGEDEDCGELHDEVEVVTLKLMEFVDTVKSLQKQSLDKLTSTWQTWSKFFYNEELDCQGIEQSTSDYYDQFQSLIDGDAENDFAGIQAWRDELKEKKKDLPQCKVEQLYGVSCTSMTTGETQCLSLVSTCPEGSWMGDICSYEGVASGYPCRMYRDGGGGAKSYAGYTIDGDIDDEFEQADTALADLSQTMQDVADESDDYQDDMHSIYKSMAKKFKDEDFDYGGINPITYRWSDSRCKSGLKDVCDIDEDDNIEEDYNCHSVEVRTSEFKIPWIDEEKSGGFLKKKVCMVLKDYCYDPNGDLPKLGLECKAEDNNNPVWVNISRKEAGNQEIGVLGKWNFKDSSADDELTDACGNTIADETEASENSCSGVDCSTVEDTDACACYCFKQENATSKISRKSTAYFIFRPKDDNSNKWVGLTNN